MYVSKKAAPLFSMLTMICLGLSEGICDRGFYKIGPMSECEPILSCEDMRDLEIGDLVGFGAVKHVYLSTLHSTSIALVFINNKMFISDFLHGLDMLQQLGPSEYVVQLIGLCLEADVYITEYHSLGNALNFHYIFPYFTLDEKFKFCMNYVRIIKYLHNSPLGTRVMCDSSSLNKTLEQYLVTFSQNLVANDLDALPEVGPLGITCGHRELGGDFVAPEQRWPHREKFSEEKLKPYSEKVDIWKIPAVCDYFLGHRWNAERFKQLVHPIHEKCREQDPRSRPSASEVLMFYERVYEQYLKGKVKAEHDEI